MSKLISDEFGLSFQIKENETDEITGVDCIFANINTVNSIASFLSTSLGPTGMDKILISKDDKITVTNDGATILNEMDMTNNPISALIVQLSQSQDDSIGDGTTSIVILASAILQSAKVLIEKGMHPIKISEGFDVALKLVVSEMERISENVSEDSSNIKKLDLVGSVSKSILLNAARTSLGSKIVSIADLSQICVDAICAVADLERKDVDLELINVRTKIGKCLTETKLINGIVLDKEFSHIQMRTEIKNAKVALLCCPFEPPRLKNKNKVLIKTVDEYKKLEDYEKEKFLEMIKFIKAAEADMVMCQWGFDDEANSLLLEYDLPAIRWVGGYELGHIATHINGAIISRFEDLRNCDLGIANVKQVCLGTDSEKIIIIDTDTNETSKGKRSVTILIRGSTEYVMSEAERSVRDALCAVRNILCNDRIVYGGGSIELHLSVFLDKLVNSDYLADSPERITNGYSPEIMDCIKAFSGALLEIPLSLAKNSGFEPLSYVEQLRKLHVSSIGNFRVGVDCFDIGEKDMKKKGVFESLVSKTSQFQMATDLVNTVLKINDVIKTE